jgi:hypothetical protein
MTHCHKRGIGNQANSHKRGIGSQAQCRRGTGSLGIAGGKRREQPLPFGSRLAG